MTSIAMDATAVCPTEDALDALFEYLVDPKITGECFSRSTPSLRDQESVSKQVQAVVFLYNYYYRKQQPELEFLAFKDFCELAVILRQPLLAFMTFMQRSNDTELENPDKQLSMTEKRIMDACDIAMSLDASQNVPSTKGWPISKVAVFLLDSAGENCFLQFGNMIEGVWSVIEKDVDFFNNNSEGGADSKHLNKRRRTFVKPSREKLGIDESVLQQLALSAVMEATGINQSEIVILKSHVVYSISKEKAATQFYIMQCTKSNNNDIRISIKDAINSLQGPLLVKSCGQWTHTSVVEYFQLLPYAEILSEWLSSKPSSGSSKLNDNYGHFGTNTNSDSPKEIENSESYMVELTIDFDGAHRMKGEDPLEVCTESKYKGRHIASEVQPDNVQKVTYTERRFNGSKGDKFKRTTECNDGNVANEIKDCNYVSFNENGMPALDSSMVISDPKHKLADKLHAVIASKGKDLSQTALRFLLSKRDKLSLQLRAIEDQIAECDKDIQAILNDVEDAWVLKLGCVIESCKDACPRSVVQQSLDALPNIQTPCQELDRVCCEKDWILPTYRVSTEDGKFRANVTVTKGMNVEVSSVGDLRPYPHEARESAAAEMLAKLCNMQN